MQPSSLLECIVKQPSQPAQASVIWLHGLGADGNDFTGIIPALAATRRYGGALYFPTCPHAQRDDEQPSNHAGLV